MMSEIELQSDTADRRHFLKLLAAAPVFAAIGTRSFAATLSTAGKRSFSDNIYTRIGVRPLINARGTWTYVSGSQELPETRRAAEEAAKYYVDMFELQAAVGRRLAALSGAESGMITSGSAGAIAVATAGCIAGTDPRNIWQLPETTGLKHEVVMMGGRSPFDSAIRSSGGKLVIAHTVDDLPKAITSQTAMVYTDWRDDKRLSQIIKITKQAGVPLFEDCADGLPPYSNFTHYLKLGADMVCFSSGKGLCGPQCSGVLLGPKKLIDAALANNNPWEGAVCRPLKVGREEIMGTLAAVEYWSRVDSAALNKEWYRRVARIQKLVTTVPGVTTSIRTPRYSNSYPTLTVVWDEQKFGLTVPQCAAMLRAGDPRIEVLTDSNPSGVLERLKSHGESEGQRHNPLQIVSMTLQPGEDLIVGNRLRQVLNKARKQAI